MVIGEPEVLAAGAVVFRPGREVLLVHRVRYDDWSFPKGKLDRGEHRTAAAVREVEEETGLGVRLGPPLVDQRYPTSRGMKRVHYWTGRAVGEDDVSRYPANDEIDRVAWVPVDRAPERLTYEHDCQTLQEALRLRRRTQPLLVLRHSEARARGSWRGEDRTRPLLQTARAQARRLPPVLAAYDVRHVVSSSSTRCVETVTPYVGTAGAELRLTDRLSQEDATARSVRKEVRRLAEELVRSGRGGLLCSHRPVLPMVFDALGLEDPGLETGELLVVHSRKGSVRAIERHLVR